MQNSGFGEPTIAKAKESGRERTDPTLILLGHDPFQRPKARNKNQSPFPRKCNVTLILQRTEDRKVKNMTCAKAHNKSAMELGI